MTMNLVQVQQALQTMPMPNILRYANGEDASVPSYMALAELNRRKMLQDQATAAEQIPQQTVKQNLENAVTKPNQMSVNPTVPQQQQVNPAAPTQQVNPAAPPPQVSPYQTPAVAAAPSATFKQGGLASLPIHMFKQHNFAPGGIVAFEEGTGDKTAGDAAQEQIRQQILRDQNNPQNNPTVAANQTLAARPPAYVNSAPFATNAPTTGVAGKPMTMTQLSEAKQQRLNNFFQMPSELQVKPEKTPEQIYADNQAIKKLAGVSDTPFAESKKRYEAIEERQKEQMSGDPMDRLIAQLGAFATADPAKGFGYQAAMSASASQALKKEQDALREQQAMTMAKLHTEFDKEDDARKRGDAAAVKVAQEAQQKHNDDLLKIQNEWTNAQSGRMNADSSASNAIANQFQAQYKPQEVANQATAANAAMINAKKPPSEIQIATEYANNPAFAKAWDAMQTTKTNAQNEQKMRDDWSKDAALRMQYDNDFEKYRKAIGVTSGFGGTFNPANYPPVYTAPDGAVYTMTPNGYVLTTPAKKK